MNEKKVFEAEILTGEKDSVKKNSGERMGDINEQIDSLKKGILVKGISALLLPILFFLLIILSIVTIIMVLFDRPFDYIFSGIFLFIILSPIYKLIKMFKK